VRAILHYQLFLQVLWLLEGGGCDLRKLHTIIWFICSFEEKKGRLGWNGCQHFLGHGRGLVL